LKKQLKKYEKNIKKKLKKGRLWFWVFHEAFQSSFPGPCFVLDTASVHPKNTLI